ncbi:MAG TPA: neutral zinc metallopeptidase [Actinophytocola sp.]|uniref:neutral zinc metallopeptidase n=1 Tax=Actinophytocola sp. TaxID=1872138 RepID=UPI002DDD4AA6|nr:neutral zinc metallopeptidase [Actinophytocola sp.]HEV2782001.1 neutral zinc metallopeptidase [Actinophytocola sp.]
MHDQGGNWSTWPPAQPPRSILAPDSPEQPNSPAKLAGVLGVVIALVLAVALLGRDDVFDGVTEIAGVPIAAPGAPNAAPGSTTPSTGAMPRAVYRLGDNPLLAEGIAMPQVTCELPAMKSDAEQLRAYYQAAIGCLDQAWRPVLASVNEPFTPPRLEIEAARSMCGEAPSADEATAYYCSGGKVIFMPVDRLLDQAGLSQAAHLTVLAHEYGHHVQALSGILTAAYDKGEPFDKKSPERLELTRRAELQANCFAGLFIASVAGRGSVGTKLARAAADSFRDTIADDAHGTIKHQVAWGRAGYDSGRTAACNTWNAPAEEVS